MILWILGAIVGFVISAFLYDDGVISLDVFIWIIVIAVGIIVFSVVSKATSTQCPKCKKCFAMQEVSRKTMGTEDTMVDVERFVKNRKGEITHSYTESVPATKYYFACVDKCKYCGHRVKVTRAATYRN